MLPTSLNESTNLDVFFNYLLLPVSSRHKPLLQALHLMFFTHVTVLQGSESQIVCSTLYHVECTKTFRGLPSYSFPSVNPIEYSPSKFFVLCFLHVWCSGMAVNLGRSYSSYFRKIPSILLSHTQDSRTTYLLKYLTIRKNSVTVLFKEGWGKIYNPFTRDRTEDIKMTHQHYTAQLLVILYVTGS